MISLFPLIPISSKSKREDPINIIVTKDQVSVLMKYLTQFQILSLLLSYLDALWHCDKKNIPGEWDYGFNTDWIRWLVYCYWRQMNPES